MSCSACVVVRSVDGAGADTAHICVLSRLQQLSLHHRHDVALPTLGLQHQQNGLMFAFCAHG